MLGIGVSSAGNGPEEKGGEVRDIHHSRHHDFQSSLSPHLMEAGMMKMRVLPTCLNRLHADT